MTIQDKTLAGLVLSTAMLLLSACSSTAVNMPSNNELLAEITMQDGRECVLSNDIFGFGVLDDDILSVDSRRGNEYFLFTTLFRCQSIQTSFALGFDSRFAQICGGGQDRILSGEENCPIRGIYKFENRKQAFAAFDALEAKRAAIRKELENAE